MAARLGKRERAARKALLAERQAILSRNLSAPQPEPQRVAVRTKSGALTVIRDRSGSTTSVDRLGSCYGRFSDPRGNALNARFEGGRPKCKPRRFNVVDPDGNSWGGCDRLRDAVEMAERLTKRRGVNHRVEENSLALA